MSVHALHQAIQYELNELIPGEWQWAFGPPSGLRRTGRVRGDYRQALVVVQRAIEVWHMMNRPRAEAA